jgi:hypothetical protein
MHQRIRETYLRRNRALTEAATTKLTAYRRPA